MEGDFMNCAGRLQKDCKKEVHGTQRLIVSNPAIRQKEIAERLSLSARTISTCVTVLKEYCIKRAGGYTYGHWEAKYNDIKYNLPVGCRKTCRFRENGK